MNPEISNLLLAQCSEFVAVHMGLHFPEERWPDLRRGIHSAAPEFGFADEEQCVQWLMSAPLTHREIEILAGNLTVGETYFLRERESFDILTERILPELVLARRGVERRLRLWSAGCCTGEEAYSLAIALQRAIPDLADWNVTILATDLNPRFLRKAAAGMFREWSFRETPAWLKEEYFRPVDENTYEILPKMRHRVTFEHLNLVEDVYPSLPTDTNAMDVIFCRNVLMYFTPEQAQRVIDRLHHSLVEGGWLIVGLTEAALPLSPPFAHVNFDGGTFYRKIYPHPSTAEEMPVEVSAPAVAPLPRRPPLPVAAMLRRARELADQGLLSEALEWCEKSVAAGKLNPVAHYLRAVVLQEQGALAEAVRSFERALSIAPDFVLAHFTLGTLHDQHGRKTEARKHYRKALHLLHACRQEELVPESEGLTAGRLAEMIQTMLEADGR
jgi:chemotaxis protein methyltransferase CheR